MIRAFAASFDQMTDPAIIRVLAKSLLITMLITAALAVLAGYTTSATFDFGFGWAPKDPSYRVADEVLGMLIAIAIFVFGFRLIAILVISFFGDTVVATVEARHYPGALEQARSVNFAGNAGLALESAVRFIVFNAIALPGYVALAVTGVGTFLLFGLVNALLLGRDLGEMVAARHLNADGRTAWLRATRVQRLILGSIVTGLFLIPLINLIAPVIGAAMATHLFHKERA